MHTPQNLKMALLVISFLTGLSLLYKAIPVSKNLDDFYAEEMYLVTYRYYFKNNDGNTTIKTYLPKNNSRQRISAEETGIKKGIQFERLAKDGNLMGVWTANKPNVFQNVDYQFMYEGKATQFHIPQNFKSTLEVAHPYLNETEHIQAFHPKISQKARELVLGSRSDLESIQRLFNFVHAIPSAPIISFTDALTTLEQNRASCNGKSRLLVALARNLGYPSRIKGGILLEHVRKRTSHAWVEILVNDQWVPFDALNGHFAYLPSNFLELYAGDEFLLVHTAGVQLDYTYEIKELDKIPFLSMNSEQFSNISPFSLWGLVEQKVLPKKGLNLLLLLPIGGLLVAFLRNVVGLKTFGVFLPVLIAMALMETGFAQGILLFLGLIMFVGLVAHPFNRMGLLQTPKMVISLTLMVLVMAVGSYLGVKTGIAWLTSLTIFPTIILTISAERFTTLIQEDGFQKASSTLLQTLMAVSVCYYVIANEWLPTVLILFPEILIWVIMLSIVLGKYIGLRWTEVLRFNPLLTPKSV